MNDAVTVRHVREPKRPDCDPGQEPRVLSETERVWKGMDGHKRLRRIVCSCAAPGSSRQGCAIVAGNKTPCQCQCHARPRPTDEE